MATIFQTTFTQRNDIALPGTFSEAYDDRRVTTRTARGLHIAGYGCFKPAGSGGNAGAAYPEAPGLSFHQPTPAQAVDADAIITTRASSTSIQTITGTGLNGVVGGTVMSPARIVTLTTSANAAWLATTATVTGISGLTGQLVTESLAIPAGGGTTVSTTTYFRTVTQVVIPVQASTAGTFTVGIAAMAALTVADLIGVVVREPIKTGVFASNLYNLNGLPANSEGNYIDSEIVPVLTAGGIWVVTETATNDLDPVYVRVAAGAGGSVLGAFRNDADSATAVLVPGKFTRTCAAGMGKAYIMHIG